VRCGVGRYGETYERAAAITGYDIQTLMNFVYVANRFPISRRREKLSWSHHAEVAALQESAQEVWLDRAATDGLSVRSLREHIRRERAAAMEGSGSDAPRSRARVTLLRCPRCGYVL